MNKSYRFSELLVGAWNGLRLYAGELMGAGFILLALNVASRGIHMASNPATESSSGVAEWAFDLFVMWVSLGWMRMLLAIVDRSEPQTVMLFRSPFRQFVRYLLSLVVVLLLVFVPVAMIDILLTSSASATGQAGWIIYAITAPLALGIGYVLMRLAIVPFVLIDKNCSTEAAIRTAWNATRGHVMTMVGLALVFVLLLVPPLLLLGLVASTGNEVFLMMIGIVPYFFTMYNLIALAAANLYRKLIPRHQAQTETDIITEAQ